MAEALIDFLQREYDYLRNREGRDFFLALGRYAEALHGKRRVRRVLRHFEQEVEEAHERHVAEEKQFIAEAKCIRRDLAERAPEIDNSDMTPPENLGSPDWPKYDRDSFARFDELAAANVSVTFPVLPKDVDDPSPLPQLIDILRGRLRAAEFGERASPNEPKKRDDLDEFAHRIGSLEGRREYILRRYRQESRTLPGLAFARLVYFGSDLNPEPPIIETDEDVGRWLDEWLRGYGQPKTIVRDFVNGNPLERREQESIAQTEQALKAELERLQRELTRRVPPGSGAVVRFYRNPWVVAVGSAILAGLVLWLFFGIGDGDSSPPATVTVTTSSLSP